MKELSDVLVKSGGGWGFTGSLDKSNLTESITPACACLIVAKVIWKDDSKVWECSCTVHRPFLPCMHHSKSPLVLGSSSDVVCIHGETVIRGFLFSKPSGSKPQESLPE